MLPAGHAAIGPDMPGPAEIFLVRHGQSTFNAAWAESPVDPLHFDAPLSPLGRLQVENARQRLAGMPAPDLVICTPLTRAIQTALGLFGQTNAPIVVSSMHRERLDNSCDVGRTAALLARDFPTLSFEHLQDPWWHDGVHDERGLCMEPDDVFGERVSEFGAWLPAQPGRLIFVVGHGTFFHRLTGQHFANCEIVRWNPAAASVNGPAAE